VPGSPFAPWFIATQSPEAFVQALEAAMVADGYPAQGLAEGAIARRVRLRWADDAERRAEVAARLGPPRRLQDPVLGVGAPVMPQNTAWSPRSGTASPRTRRP
jgi:hypothetical protein